MAKRKRRKPSHEPELVRRDGALCATFVNTASGKRKALESYADLLVWGQQAGALGAADAERLGRAAAERPEEAAAVFERAAELHACLKRILLALVARETPPAADVAAIGTSFGEALATRHLVPAAGGGYRWVWGDRGGDDLDRMLWPVLQSAAAVLTKYHRKVRQCAGEDCDLLFVDRTPGSLRKWCRVNACGHRFRSRKHYHNKVKPERNRRRRERAARDLRSRESSGQPGDENAGPSDVSES